MSWLCTGSPPPSAFIVSARLWVSNAALFHACACAACDASMPAPPRSDSSVAPLPVFNRVLRFRFIAFSPKFEAAFYARAAAPPRDALLAACPAAAILPLPGSDEGGPPLDARHGGASQLPGRL